MILNLFSDLWQPPQWNGIIEITLITPPEGGLLALAQDVEDPRVYYAKHNRYNGHDKVETNF